MTTAKLIALILLLIALAAVTIYVMGKFEQTRPTYDLIMGKLTAVKDYVTQSPNWAVITGGIGTLATVGGVAYNKLSQAKSQLTSASDVANKASAEAKALQGKLSGVESQIADQAKAYEAKLADVSKQTQTAVSQATSQANAKVVELTNLNTNLNQQKIELQNQYAKLQTRYEELRQLTAVK